MVRQWISSRTDSMWITCSSLPLPTITREISLLFVLVCTDFRHRKCDAVGGLLIKCKSVCPDKCKKKKKNCLFFYEFLESVVNRLVQRTKNSKWETNQQRGKERRGAGFLWNGNWRLVQPGDRWTAGTGWRFVEMLPDLQKPVCLPRQIITIWTKEREVWGELMTKYSRAEGGALITVAVWCSEGSGLKINQERDKVCGFNPPVVW